MTQMSVPAWLIASPVRPPQLDSRIGLSPPPLDRLPPGFVRQKAGTRNFPEWAAIATVMGAESSKQGSDVLGTAIAAIPAQEMLPSPPWCRAMHSMHVMQSMGNKGRACCGALRDGPAAIQSLSSPLHAQESNPVPGNRLQAAVGAATNGGRRTKRPPLPPPPGRQAGEPDP